MAESTKYGPWVGGDDWRSWVGVSVTSETATTATVKVRGWFESDAGSSTGSGNVKGWVGYGIGNGSVTWSGATNIDPFGESTSFYFNTGTSWTINKTHAAQTVWGYADVEGQAGIYSGYKSQCYAAVTVAAKTNYAVTFNNNGGSGAPDAQTKWYGETLTLSSTKPTRTGYTFSGWNTKADGSGTNYASGGSYTGNAALTLYAKWTAVTYGITYKANGGTGSDQTQTKTYGVNATLKAANTFSRTNYTFTNWNTAANGSGTTYAAGSTYATNAALILYAQWQLTTYSVTFDANGGTGAPAAQTKNSGSALTLSSVVPTRSGYGFLGWATTQARANAGTVDYAAGGTVAATTNQNLALYAAWKVAAPTLEIVSAYRSDGSWNPADDGTNAVVTINAESQTGATLSFSVTVGSVTVTSPSATAGNTRTFHLSNAAPSADQAYAVSVTATDSNGSATKTDVIQTAWYAIDVKRGGHGIAFGKTAKEDYLADFGMGLHVDDDVDVDGDLTVAGSYNLAASDIPSLPASKVNSGTFDAARIPSLDASKVGSGTFDAARIPDLAAGKITSGTFAAARLPASTKSAQGAMSADQFKKLAGLTYGSITITTDDSYRIDGTITFGVTYSSAPKVLLGMGASWNDNATNAERAGTLTPFVASASTTQATVHLHNRSVSSGNAITIYWAAFGTIA